MSHCLSCAAACPAKGPNLGHPPILSLIDRDGLLVKNGEPAGPYGEGKAEDSLPLYIAFLTGLRQAIEGFDSEFFWADFGSLLGRPASEQDAVDVVL